MSSAQIVFNLSIKFLSRSFLIIVGFILTFVLQFFFLLSTPVYLYRAIVIMAAKRFQPKLGSIFDGCSCLFANDYFASTTPQSNIVTTLYYNGHFKAEELKDLLLTNVIHWKDNDLISLPFMKLQQYPYKWLGFIFWKDTDDFLIDNHVHAPFPENYLVSSEELEDLVEELLNSRFPSTQSPWNFYVIENFQGLNNPTGPQSVLIVKTHHSLADGISLLNILFRLCGHDSIDKLKLPQPTFPRQGIWKTILYIFAFPINAFFELAHFFTQYYKKSLWKISDERKKSHQVIAKSSPIPCQTVKNIKNNFKVSFNSVLLAAVSAAFYKASQKEKEFCPESIYCLSVLPIKNRTNFVGLTNHFTGAVFDLPVCKVKDPVSRLCLLEKTIEYSKSSTAPALFYYLLTLMGTHVYPVSRLLLNNKYFSAAITIFPVTSLNLEMSGKVLTDSYFVLGTLEGQAGVSISITSHGENVRMVVNADAAVMSRKEAQEFVKYVEDEISYLSAKIQP